MLAASSGGTAEPMGARAGRGAGLLRRLATAVVAVPAFAWIVMQAPAWLFLLLVVAVAALALWELSRLHERSGQTVYGRLGVVLGALLTASFAFPLEGAGALVPRVSILCMSLVTAVLLAVPLWQGRPAVEPGALTLLAVLHVGWFLGHAILLRHLADGAELVLIVAGITWIGETAAYAVGSLLGRHPLAPTISPRKTVEGSVAQVIASVAAALVLGPAWLLPDWSAPSAAFAGVLLGIVGQVGDLAESAIKRSAGVKDAGGLIPGHGGVLDRVDGLLFNLPAFYYYVRLGGAG